MTRQFPNWDELYKNQSTQTMPWYFHDLDPDVIKALSDYQIYPQSIWDLGSGPGTQSLALAQMGFSVFATDVASAAVDQLLQMAREKNLTLTAQTDDILHSEVKQKFPLVLDRGVFHIFHENERSVYIQNLTRCLEPEALFLLKCFSVEEKMEGGPYRFDEPLLRALFEPQFEFLSIKQTEYQGTLEHNPKALFCVLKFKG